MTPDTQRVSWLTLICRESEIKAKGEWGVDFLRVNATIIISGIVKPGDPGHSESGLAYAEMRWEIMKSRPRVSRYKSPLLGIFYLTLFVKLFQSFSEITLSKRILSDRTSVKR